MLSLEEKQNKTTLNELFQPREIVVDANGLGIGLVDELVLPSIGPKGELYDPLYVINDED